MRTHSTGLKLTISSILAAAGVIASCAGMETSKPMSERDADRATLAENSDESMSDAERRIRQMREAIANSGTQQGGSPSSWDAPATGSEWSPDEASRANPSNVVALERPETNTPDWDAPRDATDADRALTIDQRVSKASAELASALRLRADRYPAEAASALAAINALSMVDPGVASAYLPDSSTLSSRLTPDEHAFVNAWGEMSRQLPGVLSSGDASRGVARILRDGAARLDDRTLSIPNATLCYKVDGFGIYNELPSAGERFKFVAGRVNKAIVYVELDGFSYRQTSMDGASGHAIELMQDVSLYEANSNVLAWRLSAEDISYFSRNRLRDFFVIQVIDLPSTLTVGSYELKVSVRDRVTQAVAERVIPIDVVAHDSAIRGK